MKKKIRVLHIIPSFGIGGAERLVVNLLEAYNRNEIDISVCSLYPRTGTAFEKQIEEGGFQIHYLDKRRGFDFRMIPKLFSLFKTFKPDIVHTHLSALRYSLFPAVLCKIPIQVHTLHNIALKETDILGKMIRHLSFRFGKVVPVGVSEKVADTTEKLYGVKTTVIYNGVPVKQFQKSNEVRYNYRIKENLNDDIVFLHIARFNPQKNHLILIQAFEKALSECPNLKLLLVGDGNLRPAMEKFVRDRKLEHNVLFLGQREDIPELLAASDVFVLSSDWEGFPISLMEAMASGKPVIATSVGGVPELVDNNVTGIVVPPGKISYLCKAIVLLSKKPELRKKMGKNGQIRVSNLFNVDLSAGKYEEFYLKLLGVTLQ